MRPKRASGTAAMHPMAIEISKQDRQQAIESLMRYAAEHFDERMGNVGAGALLGFSWKRSARWSTTRRWPTCRNACWRGCKRWTWKSTKTLFNTGASSTGPTADQRPRRVRATAA